jgi:colanic acid biosynthesis protein WcaH
METSKTHHWLPDEDFAYIYGKVPRFTVDLVIKTEDAGVVLIKRSLPPHVGAWHLPGGTVYKGETISAAAIRVAKNETGFDVEVLRQLGVMEFLVEIRDELTIHTISVGMEVRVLSGTLTKDENAQEIAVFTKLPEEECISEHVDFLLEKKILTK